MTESDTVVYVVDDDPKVRDGLSDLLNSVGLDCVGFGSVSDYVDFPKRDVPGCIVLDVALPDVNGLDIQAQIVNQDHPPVIFITGHPDVRSSVRAMKAGAIDFWPSRSATTS